MCNLNTGKEERLEKWCSCQGFLENRAHVDHSLRCEQRHRPPEKITCFREGRELIVCVDLQWPVIMAVLVIQKYCGGQRGVRVLW